MFIGANLVGADLDLVGLTNAYFQGINASPQHG